MSELPPAFPLDQAASDCECWACIREREVVQLRADLAAAHDLLREIGKVEYPYVTIDGEGLNEDTWRDWQTRIAALLATAPPREETGEG